LRETLQEPADEVRQLELLRLDRYLSAIAEKVDSGDLKAIDRALKIMERRSKLLGLDAPQKVAPTDPTGLEPYTGRVEDLTDEQIVARIAELEREIAVIEASAELPPGAVEPDGVHPL
jgi:hypothetical protein